METVTEATKQIEQVPQQEQNPQTINVALSAKLRDAAIISLLEDYGKFLLKKGIVDSAEAAKTKVGEICSPAIDRGIITQAIIDHVFGNIDKHAVKFSAEKSEKCCKKFMKHALVEEMGEIMDGSVSDPEFQEAIELYNQLKAATDALIVKYGDVVKQHACAFYNEFKNMFDPSFAECIQFFCN